MSFPAYTDYIDSGVAWLGSVPSHWQLTRIGRCFWERREKVSDADYPPLSVTKKGIVPQLDTAAKTDDNDNRKCVLAGDFVINSRSDRKGSSGLSDLDGSVSLINTVVRPDDGLHGRYFHHLFRSVTFQEEYYRYGKGIVADLWSTNYGEMKAISLAIPTLAEQSAIAAFVDQETAKIDALVAEQERLIALLKEKRQAVISHAVTNGLHPNAAMRDSGIEWLGAIPAHWESRPLKALIRSGSSISYGIVQPGEHVDGGVPFVQTTNMTTGTFNLDALQRTTPEIAASYPRSQLHGGEVVLGIRASIGACHVVPTHLIGANLSRGVARIECSSQLDPFFLKAVLQSDSTARYWQLSRQGSTFNEVSIDTVKNLVIPLPPTDEQLQIVAHCDSVTEQFASLLGCAERSSALLHERRSALVSAAVTGKIDVRALACPADDLEDA